MSVLENYVHPISNDKFGRPGGGPLCDKGQLDLAKLAGLCEELFGEWGHKTAIIRRFRDLFWKPAVMHVLRRAALEADEAEKARRSAAGIHDTAVRGPLKPPRTHAIGTPAALLKKYLCQEGSERRRQAFANHETTTDPHPLILKIVSTRQHVSTDKLLEYNVEISPRQLVDLTSLGVKGIRKEPHSILDDGILDDEGLPTTSQLKAKGPTDPYSVLRMWIPSSMLGQVHPGLVEDFAIAEDTKTNANTSAATRKGTAKGASSQVPAGSTAPRTRLPARSRHTLERPPQQNFSRELERPLIPPILCNSALLDAETSDPTNSRSSRFRSSFSDFDASNNRTQSSRTSQRVNFPPRGGLEHHARPQGTLNLQEISPPEDLADDRHPRDRFDIIFDTIISAKARPKKKAPSRQKLPQIPLLQTSAYIESFHDAVMSSKRHKSDNAAMSLDRRPANRISHSTVYHPTNVPGFSMDGDELPTLHSFPPPRLTRPTRTHLGFIDLSAESPVRKRKRNECPSSSQESGLVSMDENFIDLT